jgi:hypothetical protein
MVLAAKYHLVASSISEFLEGKLQNKQKTWHIKLFYILCSAMMLIFFMIYFIEIFVA